MKLRIAKQTKERLGVKSVKYAVQIFRGFWVFGSWQTVGEYNDYDYDKALQRYNDCDYSNHPWKLKEEEIVHPKK